MPIRSSMMEKNEDFQCRVAYPHIKLFKTILHFRVSKKEWKSVKQRICESKSGSLLVLNKFFVSSTQRNMKNNIFDRTNKNETNSDECHWNCMGTNKKIEMKIWMKMTWASHLQIMRTIILICFLLSLRTLKHLKGNNEGKCTPVCLLYHNSHQSMNYDTIHTQTPSKARNVFNFLPLAANYGDFPAYIEFLLNNTKKREKKSQVTNEALN